MRLRPLASVVLCFLSTSGAVNIGEIEQPCATSCVSSAISAAGCGDNDMTCQCGMPFTAISKLAAPCIATACTAAGDDLEYAPSAGAAICMSVIGRIGLPTITTATRPAPTQAAASEARIALASIPPQTTTSSEAVAMTASSLSTESTTSNTPSASSSSSTTTSESSSSSEIAFSNSTTTSSSAGGRSSSSASHSPSTTSSAVESGASSSQQSMSSVPVLGAGAVAAISLGGVMITFGVAGCAFLFGRRERKKRAAAEQTSNESGIGFGFSRSGTGFGSEYKSSSASLVSHGVSPMRPWPEVPQWPEPRKWPEDEKKTEFELPGREHYEPKELWAEPVAVRRPELDAKEEGRRGA